MKKLSLLLCTLSLFAFSTSATSLNTSMVTIEQEKPKETKEEINVKKLPKEVTFDITENYNNAEILKAYKTFLNEEHTGYIVDVKKGNKTWSIEYDEKGNPENKVNP